MIEINNGNPERALRELNRHLQLNGVLSEVKGRAHFIKPSQKRAAQKSKRAANIAKYKRSGKKSFNKFSRSLQIFGPV